MGFAVFFIAVFLLVILYMWRKPKTSLKIKSFQPEWRNILNEYVSFYHQLGDEGKKNFEERILRFLNTTRISGISTQLEDIDRILVAASAIIPIFAFPDWEYRNLKEVLIYPTSFNSNFNAGREDSRILGMVGTGYMEGKMILSKPSLRQGFKNERDKKNVGIHEFVHLIDKADGVIDGVPEALLQKQYTIPWMDMLRQKIHEINFEDTDINPYGGVNEAEFFSVISEYFFERPRLLKQKHPKVYDLMKEIFTTNLAKKYQSERVLKRDIHRNDRCPCGSGKKFKFCCGKL